MRTAIFYFSILKFLLQYMGDSDIFASTIMLIISHLCGSNSSSPVNNQTILYLFNNCLTHLRRFLSEQTGHTPSANPSHVQPIVCTLCSDMPEQHAINNSDSRAYCSIITFTGAMFALVSEV